MTRSHENVNDGTDLRLNIWNAWMNFVLNYVMPKKMRTGYVMSPSIGDKKPNITNRRTIMKTITEKVKKKKKKQCHPPSRSLTSAQVDLAVVDLMDLQETTVASWWAKGRRPSRTAFRCTYRRRRSRRY